MKQKGKTKVAPRRAVPAKKVGAEKRPAKVQHTSSHLKPHTPKKGGNKAGMVTVQQGVQVVEYPGEGKRGGSGFRGVKTVGHSG